MRVHREEPLAASKVEAEPRSEREVIEAALAASRGRFRDRRARQPDLASRQQPSITGSRL